MRSFMWRLFLCLAVIASLALAAGAPALAQSGEDGEETPEAEATDESAEAAPPAGQAFDPPGLAADADAYERSLRQRWAAPAAGQPPAAAPAPGSLAALEQTLARADSKSPIRAAEVWLALSRAWHSGGAAAGGDAARALQAAWLAIRRAENPAGRVPGLLRAAELLEGSLAQPGQALRALQEARRLGALEPDLGSRIAGLRRLVGLELINLAVDPDFPEGPQACLRFSERLSADRSLRFSDFVTVAPATAVAVHGRGEQLCVAGFGFGQRYQLTVRAGLPGRDAGVALKTALTQTVTVGNRSPSVGFRGDAFILPRSLAGGVPVTTVNLDAVALSLFRIPDRNLVRHINEEELLTTLYPYRLERLGTRDGEKVWQGQMAVSNIANRTVTTPVDVRAMMGTLRPGLYVLAAEPVDVPEREQTWERATQWLMVTDLGLTATRGADGLNVFVRSLGSARPLAGVRVAVVARTNETLAEVLTDGDGRAHFPAGKLGSGGRTPAAVMAYGPAPGAAPGAAAEGGAGAADFALLDLERAAFDLADRGVGGRPAPGPLDAWLYAERGVYRPGETVQITALLRDDTTRAVEGVPLTLKVLRPTGTVYQSGVVVVGGAGGYSLAVPLGRAAPMGTWTVQAFADPEAGPIGRLSFQVEDFVPERLAVAVTGSGPYMTAGAAGLAATPFTIQATARFLYGPPAAGLGGKAEVTLEPDGDPFPAWSGYRFGLAQETLTPRRHERPLPVTDAGGRAEFGLELPPLPDTTLPLRARLRVEVAEPGGRPTRQHLAVPVRAQPFLLGLKPEFTGNRLPEGANARISLIALGPDGRPLRRDRVRYELIREHQDWYWFLDQGRYSYRAVEREELVRAGTVTVGERTPTALDTGPLRAGRYRLEVADLGGAGTGPGGEGADGGAANPSGIATSLRFSAGWWVEPQAADTPDLAQVTSERPAYPVGGSARIHIAPPFAGQALVAVATDRVHAIRTLAVPAEGATVDLPVTADWGPGAYAVVWIYRPPTAGGDRLPVRALGVVWLGVETTTRQLAVEIEAPDRVRPRAATEVTLRVRPAGGPGGAGPGDGGDGRPDEPTFVTLAAVDEGILQLTKYQSPDPGAHYFGKRMLGLDLRDDYGRLIDPLGGPAGALRSGGDAGSGGALPVVPITVASLFSGPLAVGADGRVRVPLAIPDFDGELRLMAVAWSRGRMGSAARPMTVRDPVVAQVTLPRFLAPGDQSQVTVSVHAVEGPPGPYRLTVSGEGPVAPGAGSTPMVGGGMPERYETTLLLGRDERRALAVPLRAGGVGVGGVTVGLRGPDGGEVSHRLPIAVRSARPVATVFESRPLGPGEMVSMDPGGLAAYTPGTARMAWSFSSAPPLDVGGILEALHRYPYGCLEQVTSRGLPLLFVAELAAAIGGDPAGTARGVGGVRAGGSGSDPGAAALNAADPEADVRARVQDAIARVLDKQRFDGAFGLWGARDEAAPWLTAYATEFLTRARERGYPVPEAPYRAALTWLREQAIDGPTGPDDLAARAYALHVLALSGVLTAGPARYFHDAFRGSLPTPLARGQVAAALARLGDRGRAVPMAAAALAALPRDFAGHDYGSTVRDAAALVTVLGEAGLLDGTATAALVDRLPAPAARAGVTSTQEQAWLAAAAGLLMKGSGRLRLQVTDESPPGGSGAPVTAGTGLPTLGGRTVTVDPYQVLVAGPGAAGGGLKVRNNGQGPVWFARSASGVPALPAPAAREGLRIKRQFMTRGGNPYNLDTMRQNDVFVMVLEGEASTGIAHQALVVHPLPAGWELENSRLGAGDLSSLSWLGELTRPRAVELRDDRYVAAVDLSPQLTKIKLAFLVRAVTPGVYELPGAQFEDMYKPRFFAHQAVGRVTVAPAGGP